MACYCKPTNKDFYLREENDFFEHFSADQCVIIKQNYLQYTAGIKYEIKEEYSSPVPVEWYPHANSYYPFAEDVDPVERVNHLLGDKPSFVSLNSFYADSEVKELVYSSKNAQQNYLESNPVSFIILGKPGVGEENLGKQLADYWQCVYIEPSLLIDQEIRSESRAGQCIEFNLRCGRAVGIDVILRLVEKRVNSESAKHRGFVICGLPVIPNAMYKEDPTSSESAVFTVKDIFEEILDTTFELGVPPPSRPQLSESLKGASKSMQAESGEEKRVQNEQAGEGGIPILPLMLVDLPTQPPVDVGQDYGVCHAPEISTNYEEQLNFLFNLLKPPFLIIYLISNNKDVITKRKNEKYDIYSELNINLLQETANKAIFNYFAKRNDRANELPVDSYETFIHDTDTEVAYLKHLVTLPKNFPINVESQLDSYHYTAMNFIERRIMTHDPQYFVKLDGRTSVRRMFHVLKAKLNSLPLQKVIIPEKIVLETSPMTGEASPVIGFADAMTLEESFHQYRKLRTPSATFSWNWSDWGIKCPVALRNGVLKDGDNKYSVHFMDKIFFLSDEDAFLKFYRNPRPYLLEPYPKPTCKIFIFGPKCSGKTAVANCLAYLLNGVVLSTASIVDDYIEQRENEYREKIRQAALAEGLALLNQLRHKEAEDAEEERINLIKEWISKVKSMVESYAQLMNDLENEAERAKLELSSFPMAMVKYSIAEIETETTIAIKKLKDQFIQLNIPEGPVEVLEHFVKDKQKMLNAIPDNLKKKITPKPATVYDEFVIQHVNNALAEAVFVQENVSTQNIVEMLVAAIKDIEERYLEQGNNRGGWIIDGMLSDVDIFKDLYPDYIADDIFILKDTDDFEFLRRRFKTRGANIFRNYRDFFMSIGKVDAAWRAPSKVISTASYKNKIGRSILSEIFDDVQLDGTTAAGNLIRDETYFEELLRYKIKIIETEYYFKDINKAVLELEVTEKTLPELLLEAIRLIQDQYRVKASQFTDADRAEEIAMLSHQSVAEEAVGEESVVVKDAGEDLIEINRRYGDTYHYCPVIFHEKWVLWKGRPEYAVKFNDQVYFLCSEEDMKNFLQIPRKFLTGKPAKELPPPRICVIGIPGTGKTELAQSISFNYGIFYLSFESLVKSYYHIHSTETFEDLKKNPNINEHLRQYIHGVAPLPEDFYLKHIHQLWFEYPIKELGFVIDDFPKRLSDVQVMIKFKMIPDIVIQLSADELDMKNKLLELRLADWQANMLVKRTLWEQANKESLKDYERKRENKFKEMIEERREERYSEKKKLKVENLDDDGDIGNISQVSFDSIAEQNDMDEINRMLDANLPVLIPEPPEQFDEVRQLYETQIAEHVNEETHFLKEVQIACDRDLIPYISIPIHLEDYDKNERAVYYYTEHIKFRNQSFFERCYEVSTEVAERLLSCGYYFLSKFGKLCPVQYNENQNPFHLFQFMELKNIVFPVIHRSYIYYIIGKENVQKFKKHPFKYVDIDSVNFPNLPMRLAVTGPPKCGKTVLARRIQMEYGMKIISRGQAIRFVLTVLPFSNLAANLETVLRKGWEATDEMVVRCVEAAAIDPWGVTQGVIFDGFPNTISEVRHLSYVGLIPQLVIDLQSTKRQSFECLENDEGRMGFAKYSLRFVNHLYKEYRETAETFKPWFDREYQVTTKIFINTCNWSVWYQANKVITAVLFEIKHYYIHCHQDWPLRLGNMQVTPLEFLERQSSYKTFCPCCLHFSNMLTSGGDVPDRTGLVQWRQFYYWLCPEHIELFLKTPEAFLPPYGANALPPYLPTRLHLKLFPLNLFEDGTCIVCYKNKTVIIKGVLKYAVSYNHKTYLFDCVECLEEFMKRPAQYSFNIRFRPPENYPTLEYNELPILGMLEQYVAKDLITAVKYISRRRPVIPGLSVSTSAAVGIGLYLKVFDNAISGEYKARYLQGDELFHTRRERLVEYLHKMKHIINPYLHYEEPLPKFQIVGDSVGPSSSSSIKSQIDIL